MKYILWITTIFFSLLACKQDQKSTDSNITENVVSQSTESLPSLPLEVLQKLYDECTLIDYVFYELPLSMTVDQKPSIQNSLRHIADTSPALKASCKPVGHITYQISGHIVLEADFYYSEGCTYYIFFENREKRYANYMTQEGANSIGNLIQQGLQIQKNAAQGGN